MCRRYCEGYCTLRNGIFSDCLLANWARRKADANPQSAVVGDAIRQSASILAANPYSASTNDADPSLQSSAMQTPILHVSSTQTPSLQSSSMQTPRLEGSMIQNPRNDKQNLHCANKGTGAISNAVSACGSRGPQQVTSTSALGNLAGRDEVIQKFTAVAAYLMGLRTQITPAPAISAQANPSAAIQTQSPSTIPPPPTPIAQQVVTPPLLQPVMLPGLTAPPPARAGTVPSAVRPSQTGQNALMQPPRQQAQLIPQRLPPLQPQTQ